MQTGQKQMPQPRLARLSASPADALGHAPLAAGAMTPRQQRKISATPAWRENARFPVLVVGAALVCGLAMFALDSDTNPVLELPKLITTDTLDG